MDKSTTVLIDSRSRSETTCNLEIEKDAVCGTVQDDDIPGVVRYRTYEVLKEEVANPQLRWAYLPYSMHMAGPREAIQHMILRKV